MMGYTEDMETVNVELPASLLRAANLDKSNLSQEAARLLALELFREEKVSVSRSLWSDRNVKCPMDRGPAAQEPRRPHCGAGAVWFGCRRTQHDSTGPRA